MNTSKDRMILTKYSNCDEYIALTKSQYDAVQGRNLILFKKLGLSTDIYMSLIDPDYPVIVAG